MESDPKNWTSAMCLMRMAYSKGLQAEIIDDITVRVRIHKDGLWLENVQRSWQIEKMTNHE